MSRIPIVFGSMTFGPEGTDARTTDLAACQHILDAVKRHGVTAIDTSRAYGGAGGSEEYLGRLHAGNQFELHTKIFPTARTSDKLGDQVKLWTHSKQDIHDCLDLSLQALQVDSVDLYYLHAPDREVTFEETFEALDQEHKAGKFKRLGICNYRADEVETIVKLCQSRGWIAPTVYQGIYNCIARQTEAELIPVLRKYGLSFYTFSPLAGGFTTGAYTSKDSAVDGGRFDPSSAVGQVFRRRYFQDHYFEAMHVLKPVADRHGLTVTEVALRWLNHHSQLAPPHGDHILVGASSVEHVEQNLDDFEKGKLPSEVVEAVDQAWEIVKPHAGAYYR